MSRLLVVGIVVVAVIVAGLFILAGRDVERAPTRIEKVVPLANLA